MNEFVLVAKIKLAPSTLEQKELIETLQAMKNACNYVSKVAFANKGLSACDILPPPTLTLRGRGFLGRTS